MQIIIEKWKSIPYGVFWAFFEKIKYSDKIEYSLRGKNKKKTKRKKKTTTKKQEEKQEEKQKGKKKGTTNDINYAFIYFKK